MANILISIAMCTYNGEKYLKEQLDSICKQTIKNFELIITDDCSNDATVNIIQSYQRNNSRIKLYINEKNLGFKKNFEKAISLCHGNYIALADQDDVWKTNKLELFLSQIQQNSLIYSDAILINENSDRLNKELIRSEGRNLVKGKCNKAFLVDNCVSGNTLMFKKELIPHILPIPQEISYHDIWIVFIASTYGTITYTDESMTFYRRHVQQVTYRNTKYNYQGLMRLYTYKINQFYEVYKTPVSHKYDLKVFNSVAATDLVTKSIIQSLLAHYSSYDSIYFNKKLNLLLHKHKDDILAITNKEERDSKVYALSVGLKYYRNIFFYSYSFFKGLLRIIRLKTKNIRKRLLLTSHKDT